MPKIRRLGGFTDATVRAFVSPADELRARGKLGPYGAELVESEEAGTGEAVNADTGEVTQPGEPLPEVEQAEGEPLEEASWPGNSSETSPTKPPKTDAPNKGNRRKRARTEGDRSSSTAESGTAPTATTNGPATPA